MKPADYRHLVALSLTPEQIAGVMEIMERDDDERKAKGRARWRKHQENKKNANVSSLQETLTANSRASVTRGEDKPLPQKIESQESKKDSTRVPRNDVSEFKADLATDLDAELLDSFVKVRRSKRGALTGYAAKLFRSDAEACGMSAREAAVECVRSAWITVKPEYFRSRQSVPQARAGPAQKPISLADRAGALARELGEANVRSRDGGSGVPALIPDLSVVSGGRR